LSLAEKEIGEMSGGVGNVDVFKPEKEIDC